MKTGNILIVVFGLFMLAAIYVTMPPYERLSILPEKEEQIDIELREMELKADTILMNLRKFNKEIDSLNKEIEKWK